MACSQTINQGSHGDGKGRLLDNDMNDNGICDDDQIYGCQDAGDDQRSSPAFFFEIICKWAKDYSQLWFPSQ